MIKKVEKVIGVLKTGGIVAVPTDTVYGLLANASLDEAIKKIYTIKRRKEKKPLVLFVRSNDELPGYLVISPAAQNLITTFWPGPLTVIFKTNRGAPNSLLSKDNTIGVRMPKGGLIQELLKMADFPIASTSCNRSGSPPLSNKEEISKEFPGEIDLVIDYDTVSGLPSTVLDVSGNFPVLIRKGSIGLAELEDFLGVIQLADPLSYNVLFLCTGNTCRSPMAQAILTYLVPDTLKTKVKIDSAGIAPLGKCGLVPYTQTVLRELGITDFDHTSKELTPRLIEWADYIFAMEKVQLLKAITLGAGSKVHLLGEDNLGEILDPMGHTLDTYREVGNNLQAIIQNTFLPEINRRFVL